MVFEKTTVLLEVNAGGPSPSGCHQSTQSHNGNGVLVTYMNTHLLSVFISICLSLLPAWRAKDESGKNPAKATKTAVESAYDDRQALAGHSLRKAEEDIRNFYCVERKRDICRYL